MNCARKGRRISTPRVAATLAACTLTLVAAPAADAAKPSVIGFGAQPAPGSSEVILGEIDPGGERTEFLADYGLASSQWCAEQPAVETPLGGVGVQVGPLGISIWLGGFGGPPPHSTSPTPLGYSDQEEHAVAVELDELSPGAEYCAELVAFNASGAAASAKIVFDLGAPSVVGTHFVAASNTLQAEIDPAGDATEYQVVYAPLASEWCSSSGARGTPARLGELTPLDFSDDSFHPVSVHLGGLVAGAEYCAAMDAVNEAGSSLGFQVSFRERPTVEGLTPSSGPASGGTTVRIEGENLAGTSAVCFGSTAASIESVAPNEVVVSAPAHAAEQVDVTVTTPAGTSAASEADLFTYEGGTEGGTGQGSTGPTGESGSGGSGGSGAGGGTNGSGGGSGSTGVTAGGVEGPALGKTEQVGGVVEPVTVRLAGSSLFVTLVNGATIPDGSEIDATHGSVVITVVEPDGRTVSAEVHGGRFRIHQDPDGETHFVLTLPLTGCPRTKLPRGSAAATSARRHRRRRPRARYLWVKERGGHWGTNGRYVSTSVEGTTWLTLDQCARSQVIVTEGRVRVRNLVTHRTRTVGTGGHYTAKARRPRHRRRG
ncbi:MAG TPA: IPT/TIG domain-containing protein [Solirubrobacteraceae bacterium]|nr:IPT/TIG domain-containing protein [Solirubrobacteraceae bacterium]